MRIIGLGFVAAACALTSGCIAFPGIPDWELIEEARTQMEIAEQADADLLAPSLVLRSEDGLMVDMVIDGQPVRLRAEIGQAGIVLDPDVAARLGLVSTARTRAMVGPIRVDGYSAQADVASGPGISRQRVFWYDGSTEPEADGIVNIANLPYEEVTLQFAPPRDDDVAIVLPTIQTTEHIVHPQRVGDRTINMRFKLGNQRTFATTAAGSQLAETLGGQWGGERTREPVAYGIARSMRPMAFGAPLLIGGSPALAIDAILVRTRDFAGDTELPDDPDVADNAILVKADDGSRANYFVTIGRDVLSRCSSATYVRATAQLTLRCRARS